MNVPAIRRLIHATTETSSKRPDRRRSRSAAGLVPMVVATTLAATASADPQASGGAAVPAQRLVPAQPVVPIRPATPARTAPAAETKVAAPSNVAPPNTGAGDDGRPDSAPDAPADASQAGSKAPPFSPEEIVELKAIYLVLDPDGQASMRAYYKDFEVELEDALGLAAERSASTRRGQQIVRAMRNLKFTRTPEAVLSARSTLGFGGRPFPDADAAEEDEIAEWVHLHTMAGEWELLGRFLASRPEAEAEPVYAAVLQSINRGDAGLLPEEILALAESAPSDFKDWQMKALVGMLETSAARNGTSLLLAALRGETRYFGTSDPERRRRTIDFLAGAGLVAEAALFLPPLEQARLEQDVALMIVHARNRLDLAEQAGEGPRADGLRLEAFDILAEAALLEGGDTDERRQALARAIELVDSTPRARTEPWLELVFADSGLGPAALEQLALAAASIGDRKTDEAERARAVLNLKEAIDLLLSRDEVAAELAAGALRVPLRMVTTALVAEMEQAAEKQGSRQFVGAGATSLFNAIPSERWLSSLEPSLATRARKAAISIAMTCDETDRAIELLEDSIAADRFGAAGYGDHFLSSWIRRLAPNSNLDAQTASFYAFYRDAMPTAPLTRGRQRRNLDRLDMVMETLAASGVDPRGLPAIVPAFQGCHARTEVYDRADLERVFGPIAEIPAPTAARLAASMAASLNGDWRNREAQRAGGNRRSDDEIAQLVDRGYGVAIELMDAALAQRPDAWNLAVLAAALTYDRLQFQESISGGPDPETFDAYRRDAFSAFADAARRYRESLERGETRDDPSVLRRWFGAAMGTAELNFLRPDDLPREGTLQDDQIDLIRNAFDAFEPEARDRHKTAFANDVQQAVGRATPEVKPRLVRHALRIIGDHPAGASLRAMQELYRDLVRDEIKLRLAIDGDDRVGVDEPFGAMLSLRFTHAVDRETGGFGKYLQNGVYARVGNQFRVVNYRDDLEKTIRDAFGDRFEIDAIGFFDAFMPARGVVEENQEGWMEKPLAYLVLRRRDAAIDTVPEVAMDMQFTDQTGPVTLGIASNTPLIAGGEDRTTRPCRNLEIDQVVDVRGLVEGDGEPVTLELRLRGEGVLPDVREALRGLDTSLAGFEIAEDGIEIDPPIVVSDGSGATTPMTMRMGGPVAPAGGYPEPDENGVYRLPIEQTVRIVYRPTGAPVGDAFTMPTLSGEFDGAVVSRFYDDLDIMPVEGDRVPLTVGFWSPVRLVLAIVLAGFVAGVAMAILRRRPAATDDAGRTWAPARLTPLGVVTSLRRLESERGASLGDERSRSLRAEIDRLERTWFGPESGDRVPEERDLRAVVDRWSAA
jgi:hypothetical protein